MGFRAVKRLDLGGGRYAEPGEKVDLGHLDEAAIELLKAKGAVEVLKRRRAAVVKESEVKDGSDN